MLMVQAALPVCCFAKDPVNLILKVPSIPAGRVRAASEGTHVCLVCVWRMRQGGTDTKMSPPYNTFLHVIKPTLERFGVQVTPELVRRYVRCE